MCPWVNEVDNRDLQKNGSHCESTSEEEATTKNKSFMNVDTSSQGFKSIISTFLTKV